MARILGIDFGAKRVGLAVTDPLKIIATALTTVENKTALDFIQQYIKSNEVERILIGYPLDLRGNPTHATPMVDWFIVELSKRVGSIPIEKRDESFTSKMAMKTLIDSGVKKKQRRDKKLLDQISATIILQEYLQNL